MNPRHSWKGYLQLSLIAIPVKAYAAAVSGADIHLHQLHAPCKSRIRYKKVCPLHGEVQDIVSAYEYAQERYVVVDPDELDKLRSEADKAIHIEAFIKPGSLDPLYASGKSYYLVPDGPLAQKAYALLRQGMAATDRQAVAQVVMHGKERVVWLRILEGLLVMTQLSYHAQVSRPGDLAEQAPPCTILPKELALLHTVMEACTPETFDYSSFQDQYTRKLSQLIDAKVAGQELVASPAAAATPILDLLDALEQSVAQKTKGAKKARGKGPKTGSQKAAV